MKAQNIEKIEKFLRTLNVEDIDIPYHVDIKEIDLNNPFNSIYEMIDEGGGFDIEIIYYSNAIEFLRNNDPSLQNSLQIAEELGYSPSKLNSEILASLLAGDIAREEFSDLKPEIESFFEEIKEDEEDEEEESETES